MMIITKTIIIIMFSRHHRRDASLACRRRDDVTLLSRASRGRGRRRAYMSSGNSGSGSWEHVKREDALMPTDADAAGGDIAVGVLAIQGSFREHAALVRKAHPMARAVEVRKASHLRGLRGLIIPGGESTTMANIARRFNLFEPLRAFQASGKCVWGTCAGLIFLADSLQGGAKEGGQELLGGLDVAVNRNFFGSQIDSFECQIPWTATEEDEEASPSFRAVFIRAPAIVSAGPGVEVLAKYVLPEAKRAKLIGTADEGREEVIIAVRQGKLLATSFHPEITADTRWHKLFVRMCAKEAPYELPEDDEEEVVATIRLPDLPVFDDSVIAPVEGKS